MKPLGVGYLLLFWESREGEGISLGLLGASPLAHEIIGAAWGGKGVRVATQAPAAAALS